MRVKNLVCLTVAVVVAQLGLATAEASNVRPTNIPANIRLRTDYAVAGVGGMRWKNDWTDGPSTAVIKDLTLSGNATGTVTKAYLYWFVVAPGYDPGTYHRFDAFDPNDHPPRPIVDNPDVFSFAEKVAYSKAMTFEELDLVVGRPDLGVPGVEILELGPSYGNNWPGSYPSSESFAFRADVTALVRVDGATPVNLRTVAYKLGGFAKSCEGASLVIFYNDGNAANDRDLYLFEGNDSNYGTTWDGVGWDVSLSGFTYRLNSGEAKLQLHIGDAQSGKDDGELFLDGRLFLPFGSRWNGDTVPAAEDYFPNGFDTTGRLWDIITLRGFESQLLQGGIPWLTAGESTDYWNLVLAIVDLPSSPTSTETPVDQNNKVPKVDCQVPIAVEANKSTGLPAVQFSATVSDPEGDKVTVIWAYAATSGGSTTVLASEVVTFAQANEQKVVFYTHPSLAPSATQQIVVSVTDGKPGHAAQSCSINVLTIEAKPPVVSSGTPIVVQGHGDTGGAILPNFQNASGYVGYVVNGNPLDGSELYRIGTDGKTIVAWDNHSRTVSTLLLTQLPGAGAFYGVGIHPITVVVTDEALNSSSAIKYFEVKRAPGNRAPVASADEAFARFGQAISIPVLVNDFDVDADPFLLDHIVGEVILTQLGGTAKVNADGTFTYVAPSSPGGGSFGIDTFSYRIKDIPPDPDQSLAATPLGTVNIRVSFINEPPVAEEDHLITNEDVPVTFPLSFLTSNDTDADYDSLEVVSALFGLPSHGTLTDAGGGSWKYTPVLNYSGPDSFGYTITDGYNAYATGTVMVTVRPVNDNPVAVNDFGKSHDGPVTFSLLDNDFDVDGGALSLATLSYTGTGVLVANGDGTVTYTPAPGFVGVETAKYTVSDGLGGISQVAVVTLRTTVNEPPVASNGSNTTLLGTPVSGQLLATDQDEDVLTFGPPSLFSANGVAVSIDSRGTYTYGSANSAGTDTFRFTVNDGFGGSSSATITINVKAPNRPPGAMNDGVTTPEDTAVDISVLVNDSDPDSDHLAVVLALPFPPIHGTAVVNSNGTITYTPAANFNGSDSFVYAITDGNLTSTATVTITVVPVNDAPVANNQSITTLKNVAYSGQLTASDADANATLTFGLLIQPLHGTVSLAANGAYVYVPTTGYSGPDSFTFAVNDGNGGTASAAVSVTVTPTGCDLYPITVHINTVKDLVKGMSFDVYGGSNPGNFGWLTWAGSPSEPTLVTSLTIPGNSGTYVNPSNPSDHQVSITDWVQGSPGIQNSSSVRAKLDLLKTIDISVPVWDSVNRSGNNTLYKVVNFARIRITDYSLPNKNTITATFLSLDDCGQN